MSNNTAPGAPGGPNQSRNGNVVVKRKKPAGDPFFSGPKPRTQPPKLPVNGQKLPQSNGANPLSIAQAKTAQPIPGKPVTVNVKPSMLPDRVSGFSDPQIALGKIPYTDYKLVTTKKDLLDGLRFHLMQLAGDGVVDIRNESEFPKPAKLHRRDPFAVSFDGVKEESFEPRDGLNASEREELSKRKEIRQKEREANLAQIAPSQSASRKVPQFKKKTQQVFRQDLTEEDKRRIQMNYEEKLPWHLEDFDNKHCYVGKHQLGAVSTHVVFVREGGPDPSTTRFRMVPVEKFYQFKRKSNIRAMNIDEAEAAMNKKTHTEPAWFEAQQEKKRKVMYEELLAKQAKGLFSGAQMSNIAGRQGEEADLDYEEDFADDEEGGLFDEKDEDEKLAEKKIKEENLKANIFDMKLVQEYDEEEERERLEEEMRKRGSKGIRRALEKREHNFNHGSDSEEHSSDDSEEERERLEQERLKKEEEGGGGEEGKKSALPSGANTPSGRKEKTAGNASDREGIGGGIKKSISSKSLKRPGSPNLSDASGTDTSTTRKKLKSRHLPLSQSSSTLNVPTLGRPYSGNSIRGGTGAGSDTEMAGSDREGGSAMSDGERNRRIRLRVTSPDGSRAGSPSAITRPTSTAPPGEGSPASTSGTGADAPRFPTTEDIRQVVNRPGGVTVKQLLRDIKPPPGRAQELVALVQQVARLDKTKGVLVMKDQ